MWEVVSFLIAFAAFMLILHYMVDPRELFRDINRLKGSEPRIQALEDEVKALKEAVDALQKSNQR